jgi:threonine synthase
LAETEGILTETAGGVTVATLQAAIERGIVGSADEIVLVISGNGLKTLDVLEADVGAPITPSVAAFEAWWATNGGAA